MGKAELDLTESHLKSLLKTEKNPKRIEAINQLIKAIRAFQKRRDSQDSQNSLKKNDTSYMNR